MENNEKKEHEINYFEELKVLAKLVKMHEVTKQDINKNFTEEEQLHLYNLEKDGNISFINEDGYEVLIVTAQGHAAIFYAKNYEAITKLYETLKNNDIVFDKDKFFDFIKSQFMLGRPEDILTVQRFEQYINGPEEKTNKKVRKSSRKTNK